LKTDDLISVRTGTSGAWSKGMKRSTCGQR